MTKNKILFKFVICFLIISQILTKEKITKNVLAFTFPGGKSHTFVFKEVFNYTIEKLKQDNSDIEYKFHILSHNYDKQTWTDSDFKIYGFGDVSQYEEKFFQALEQARQDPVLGYMNFNNAMIHLYTDFLNDKAVLEQLRKIKFDLIIADVINVLSVFLRKELNIPLKMYLNPTCIYTWQNEVFEFNPSYIPLLGTTFTDHMSFSQRFINQIFLYGTRASYKLFGYLQNKVFQEYGYNDYYEAFVVDAVYLNQCVNGLHYPAALPPNMQSIGAILPKPAKPVTDESLNTFLNKYKKSIYISQGTIIKVIRLETFKILFETFSDVGFILSLKKGVYEEVELPKNVLIKNWLPQNDLLGDARVAAFITHGGLNSMLESLYHAKPMIVIGTNIDQINTAVIVNERKYGYGITNENDITIDKLIPMIKDLLENKEYNVNCLQAARFIKHEDGKEKFYYWINYIMENGYSHLLIPAYSNFSFIHLQSLDIIIVLIIAFAVLCKIIRWLFSKK
jgi:UDP:flavonoid glycosyltransferase YjiC (YdhE family)